jgi:hypothetical protein
MAVSFNNLVNDDGSNTVGTLIDKAELQLLLVDTVPAVRTDTGTVNNWAPGIDGHTYTRWNGASDLTVTGVGAGVNGQRWSFRNGSTKVASFAYISGSSSVGNQFVNNVTSAATPIGPGGSATWEYVSPYWILTAHEQGAWITPAFNAAVFGASGAQTWTLAAGDVTALAYYLRGRTLDIQLTLDTTSVGGTPSTDLWLLNTGYGGFTAQASQFNGPNAFTSDNNVVKRGFWQVNASGTLVRFLIEAFPNWTASTNLTAVYAQPRFAVL